ncbi:MAG: glycosyltransferase family 2 protein [Clostridia bacterium]|nr:glycosyltransferase family 2 protein [Clostridia bacterium]
MKLSLIIPCYNEQDNIMPFFEETVKAFQNMPKAVRSLEMIFVNDGSNDMTSRNLKDLYNSYSSVVTVVEFSRNFGKEAAMLAGLRHATGDFITIIDADLQQRPEIVVKMVEHLLQNEDCDMVAAYQEERIEGKLMSFMKNTFYKFINAASEIDFFRGASDFRTFRKNVAEAILSMPEYYRFSKGIFSWIGFNTHFMPYIAEERFSGTTKFSFFKSLKYALEGIIAFTTLPLKLATGVGIFTFALSILYMLIVIIQKLFFGVDVPGYATIVVLILFLGGLQLLLTGVAGEYLARTYIQGKNRPLYIEKQVLKPKSTELNEGNINE